jgi:DNA sulfur modification protein DndD
VLLEFIELNNYAIFKHARFDLTVDAESPIILFTGNNGGGKTSTLDAFRLSLHGRRSFLNGITDQNYEAFIRGRFHNGDLREPCSIRVAFQYNELSDTHHVELHRSWSVKKSRVSEYFALKLDGVPLTGETAEELMVQILPPEILGFFFFDGEKIGDLADWENEDDYKLFSSVNDLLGLRLVDQLIQDLDRVIITEHKGRPEADLAGLATTLSNLESRRLEVLADFKNAKSSFGASNRALERARQRVSSMGGLFVDRRKADEKARDAAKAVCDSALDAMRQEAAAYLPLLIAPRMLTELQKGIDISDKVESLNVIDRALKEAEPRLQDALSEAGFSRSSDALKRIFADAMLPKPVALNAQPLSLSLAEASWMRAILSNELPRVQRKIAELTASYDENLQTFLKLDSTLSASPVGDPDVEQALTDLQEFQRSYFEAESRVEHHRGQLAECDRSISEVAERSRKARHEHFRDRRLAKREDLLGRILEALPDYANSSRVAKEQKFAELLEGALKSLWHKEGRISDVHVDLKRRVIRLSGAGGEINKNDLSAAEKQLFAIAFIFALARLSGRYLPFVVDTPLGRLDHAHRNRLISDFLPSASHQIILFSTDTEIVGSLYDKAKPLINRHYELADFNGGATAPVQLEVAL